MWALCAPRGRRMQPLACSPSHAPPAPAPWRCPAAVSAPRRPALAWRRPAPRLGPRWHSPRLHGGGGRGKQLGARRCEAERDVGEIKSEAEGWKGEVAGRKGGWQRVGVSPLTRVARLAGLDGAAEHDVGRGRLLLHLRGRCGRAGWGGGDSTQHLHRSHALPPSAGARARMHARTLPQHDHATHKHTHNQRNNTPASSAPPRLLPLPPPPGAWPSPPLTPYCDAARACSWRAGCREICVHSKGRGGGSEGGGWGGSVGGAHEQGARARARGKALPQPALTLTSPQPHTKPTCGTSGGTLPWV